MKGYTVPSVFVAVDRYSAPIRKMAGATNAFVNASRVGLAHTERAWRRLISPLTAVNRLLMGAGYYVGLFTFIALMRGAIKTIADFQKVQIDIAAVTATSVKQNKALSNQARDLAVNYGLAAESISRVQLALVKAGMNKGADMTNVLAMTPAITLGVRAMGGSEEELTRMLTADMKAFKLGPESAMDIMDRYAKIVDVSTLDFESLNTMLANARQAKALTGTGMKSFEEMLVRMAIIRDAAIHVASGGTGSKNFDIKNELAGITQEEAFKKILASASLTKRAIEMYGPKTFQSVVPYVNAFKSGDMAKVDAAFRERLQGYVKTLADFKMQGITAQWDKAKSAYQELILSIDDGNGPISKALTNYIQVASAVLLLTANSDAARSGLAKMSPEIVKTAENYKYWLKILGYVTGAFLAMRLVIFAWSTMVGVATVVTGIFNIAQGIKFGLLGMNAMALSGSALALGAYRAAIWIATIATRIFSTALFTTPLGWAILGFGALVLMLTKTGDKYEAISDSAKKASEAMKGMNIQESIYSSGGKIPKHMQLFPNQKFGNLTPSPMPARRQYLDEKILNFILDDIKNIPKMFTGRSMEPVLAGDGFGSFVQQPQKLDSMQTVLNGLIKHLGDSTNTLNINGAPAGSTVTGDNKFKFDIQPKMDSTFRRN